MSNVLTIFLKEREIGVVTELPGDRNVFTFHENYINDPNRPIFSLSCKDMYGDLITYMKSSQTRLPPFFSNLLPEGLLREYIAKQVSVPAQREFHLLRMLGQDLPGALRAVPSEAISNFSTLDGEKSRVELASDGTFHFSLAGVQLKFSAIKNKGKGLTIPSYGVGGAWIVKLPDARYAHVPENEYAMMALAKAIGINVPETLLMDLNAIQGLPDGLPYQGKKAFVIKRFDRDEKYGAIHMEDFAQILNVYPEKKYAQASYRTIAHIVWQETGETGIKELIERLVFMVLIGNGDMHLKNWSLLYGDGVTPTLAPAYDFVSTIPYIPGDSLALNLSGKKSFQSITREDFRQLALKTRLPEKIVMDSVDKTIEHFFQHWSKAHAYGVHKDLKMIIDKHLKSLSLFRGNSLP